MDVWRPELTPKCGLITFFLYTVVFIMFGFILKGQSDNVVDFSLRYDNDVKCKGKAECTLDIIIPAGKTLKGSEKSPLYFYYQLTNFY